MGKGWREDFDAMAAKTVFRRLIGKWGLMSIDYQKADPGTLAAAEALAKGQFDDEDIPTILPETGKAEPIVTQGLEVDNETGEVKE